MRDGVKLSADVYLPANDGHIEPGPFPVILERTPYSKRRWPANCPDGVFWARRGYAYVNQDCRGRFGSEGVFAAYPGEGDDGVDTVAWVMRQSWCNGRIGLTGSSYFASTAQAILVRDPPGIASAVIRVGAGNYHEDGAWSGGAFQLTHNVNYGLGLAATGPTADRDAKIRDAFVRAQAPAAAFDLMRRSPLPRGGSVFALSPNDDAWYQEWQRHELYDDYWKQNGYTFDYGKAPDVPILLIGQWYDAFNGGMLDAFAGTLVHFARLERDGRLAPPLPR
jgi:putative CocE/NonD family hydrolase